MPSVVSLCWNSFIFFSFLGSFAWIYFPGKRVFRLEILRGVWEKCRPGSGLLTSRRRCRGGSLGRRPPGTLGSLYLTVRSCHPRSLRLRRFSVLPMRLNRATQELLISVSSCCKFATDSVFSSSIPFVCLYIYTYLGLGRVIVSNSIEWGNISIWVSFIFL